MPYSKQWGSWQSHDEEEGPRNRVQQGRKHDDDELMDAAVEKTDSETEPVVLREAPKPRGRRSRGSPSSSRSRTPPNQQAVPAVPHRRGRHLEKGAKKEGPERDSCAEGTAGEDCKGSGG